MSYLVLFMQGKHLYFIIIQHLYLIITQHLYFITADHEAQVTAFAKRLQNTVGQVHYGTGISCQRSGTTTWT